MSVADPSLDAFVEGTRVGERARACVAACAGIPTEDLEKLAAFGDYLRLIKLSHLADRQAATMEGAPADPYVSAGGTL